MTQGFYEQLGVASSASPREIRAAYVRVIGQIRKRRRALLDQGGDTTRLDQHRAEIDEAWSILSDAVRRRRYDAFLALQQQGWTTAPDEVWKRAAGSLVHPTAAAAAEVLRVGTGLAVGALPPAPSPVVAGATSADEVTVTVSHRTQPTVVPLATEVELEEDDLPSASVVPLPTALPTAPAPSLKIVDGAATSAPVIVMPTPQAPMAPTPPVRRDLDAGGIEALIDRHGLSGALLREVRHARGLSLQELSDSSRISVRYLEAVEQDDYERLPSATFVRGYVREVARLLELDEVRVVDGYMRRFAGEG